MFISHLHLSLLLNRRPTVADLSPAARAIVIEDAPAGLEGARRAGMKCVGVLTGHAELHADLVVHRLTDLASDSLERLLA